MLNEIIFPVRGVSAQTKANTKRFYELIDRLGDDKVDESVLLALVNKGICVTAKSKHADETPLMKALRHDYEEVARRLIEKNADVNARNRSGETVLDQVVIHNLNPKLRRKMHMLMDAKADINVSSKEFTKLHFAVAAGDQALCTRLIAEGANLEARDKSGYTPLGKAIDLYDEPMCELLIRNGADVFSRNFLYIAAVAGLTRVCEIILDKGEYVDRPCRVAEDGTVEAPETAFMAAGGFGNADTCATLLRRGANIDFQDSTGRTTLHRAMMSSHYSVSKLLMESGANMTLRDKDQNTILHDAAAGRWKDSGEALELLDIMLALKMDIEAQNKNGKTPLHIACHWSSSVFADALIARGANVKARDKALRTPLHNVASSFRSEEASKTITSLIAHGAEIEAVDENGNTAMHLAAYNINIPGIKELLAHNANIMARNHQQQTMLHFAVKDRGAELITFLLQNGVELEARDEEGCTALYRAVEKGNVEAVKTLLAAKANVETRDNNGKSLLDLVLEKDYPEIAYLLLDAGITIPASGLYEANTPLHVAAFANHLPRLERLLEENPDVNVTNVSKEAPLHIAAFYGHLESTLALIHANAKLDVREQYLMTPLMSAAQGMKLHGNTKRCGQPAKVIEALAEAGADLELGNHVGATALHVAGAGEHIPAIEALAKAGANIEARNNYLETPLFSYHTNNTYNMSVYEVLVGRGANVYAADDAGGTIMQSPMRHTIEEVDRMDKKYQQFVDKCTPPGSAKDVYKLLAVYPLADPQADIDQYAHLRQIFRHARWKSQQQASGIIKQLHEDGTINAAFAEELRGVAEEKLQTMQGRAGWAK